MDHHGVPANDFYDRVTKKTWAFPPDGSMLNAEPIWITATRQGVRTDVFDWPLSQMQKGPNVAAIFEFECAKFDGKLNPQQRMDEVLDAYEKDSGDPPVRLLMGYMEPVDHAGHSKGPESPETADAVLKADAVLQKTFDRVSKDFEVKRKSPDDVLYFLMTTDHGMTTVKTLVRLDFVLNLPPETGTRHGGRDEAATAPATEPATQPGWPGGGATHRDVTVVTSGPLGNVCVFSRRRCRRRSGRRGSMGIIEIAAGEASNLRAYRQEELPAEWAYRNADRIGDIVVITERDRIRSAIEFREAEYPAGQGKGERRRSRWGCMGMRWRGIRIWKGLRACGGARGIGAGRIWGLCIRRSSMRRWRSGWGSRRRRERGRRSRGRSSFSLRRCLPVAGK